MLTVRLPKELEERLELLTQTTKRTKSFYIKEALIKYLEDMEDFYTTIDRISKPHANYLTTDEIKQRLNT